MLTDDFNNRLVVMYYFSKLEPQTPTHYSSIYIYSRWALKHAQHYHQWITLFTSSPVSSGWSLRPIWRRATSFFPPQYFL